MAGPDSAPLRVSYVTMQFPVASETFAATDISALRGLGVEVTVHAYRRRGGDCSRLLGERGLQDLPLTHGGPGTPASFARCLLRRPRLAGELLLWCLAGARKHPRHLAASLALIPRTLAIFAEIERRRPDVVHLFWGHYPAMAGYLVKRHLPECVLSQFLGAYDLLRGYPGSSRLARQADVVWTHARANLPELAALGIPRRRIEVVCRGVDLAAVDRCRAGAKVKVPGRIVTAGRLLPGKRFDAVIAVFSELVRCRPEATLTILGDGPEAGRLLALAGQYGVADRIRFAGHVSQAEVFREMWQGEWFLFLSRKESERLPNVVKEAMACGCVPVVAETPGIDELIEHGRNGFICPDADRAALVALLSAADASRATLAAAGRHCIEERFDVRKTMAAYRARWQELGEGRG